MIKTGTVFIIMQDTREHMFTYIKTSNIFDIKDRISCGHDTSK